METSQRHHHLRHHSAGQLENLTDDVQEKIIKSSSRFKKPQSSSDNPMPVASGETSGKEKKKKDPLPRITIFFTH